MQGWKVTVRHGVKIEEEKDEKHVGKLFWKNPKTKCQVALDLKAFRL